MIPRGLCREAPKVAEHIAVWVRPIEKSATSEFETPSPFSMFKQNDKKGEGQIVIKTHEKTTSASKSYT